MGNPSVALHTSQLILQPIPLLHLRHSSFSNPFFASPMSQALHLIHLASMQSSFSNLSVTSPTSQLILQPCRFTYVTPHSPTLVLLHLRHSSFSNPSLASLTSQALHLAELYTVEQSSFFNLYRHFTYVTAHSPTLPLLHLRHSSFFNPFFAPPMSQALHLIHLASKQSSFSNHSVTSPTSQLILQSFRHFT